MEKHPERVIEHAVKGMLPKNTLGRAMGMKLKVYAGADVGGVGLDQGHGLALHVGAHEGALRVVVLE